jgi:phospholipid transport system substrate-binding protein
MANSLCGAMAEPAPSDLLQSIGCLLFSGVFWRNPPCKSEILWSRVMMHAAAKYALPPVLFVLISLYSSSPSFAGAPTEEIRTAVNQGVEILRSAKLDDERQRADVINRLRAIVYPLFDFREMAKRSLGAHWRRINRQQQEEFVASFTDLLEKTYADKIDLYDGQKVIYSSETMDNDFAVVNTKLIGKNQSYSVDYKLQLVDGKWKVYDIVAENISLINNYRSQFNRILTNSSFDDLIQRIKSKI